MYALFHEGFPFVEPVVPPLSEGLWRKYRAEDPKIAQGPETANYVSQPGIFRIIPRENVEL